MKRIMVKSVFECFDYVVDTNDGKPYAVISIQDYKRNGFGFRFVENDLCKGVLTLLFDDIEKSVDGYKLFDREQAKAIINFVNQFIDVDVLLIHCYAGQSRSSAVGAFVVKMLGGDNSNYFKYRTPNTFVYQMLLDVWDIHLVSTESMKPKCKHQVQE